MTKKIVLKSDQDWLTVTVQYLKFKRNFQGIKTEAYQTSSTQRIIQGRAEIWNFSSSVQLDISQVSTANE